MTKVYKDKFNTLESFKENIELHLLPYTSEENQELFNSCISFANMFFEKDSKTPYKPSTLELMAKSALSIVASLSGVMSTLSFVEGDKTAAAIQFFSGIGLSSLTCLYDEENIQNKDAELKYEQDFCVCVEKYLTGEAVDMCNNQQEFSLN